MSRKLMPTTHQQKRRLVIPVVRVHGTDDTEIINRFAYPRKDL